MKLIKNSTARHEPELKKFPPLIIIQGPTASGKTRLGLHIARYLDTDIISVDSRQVYRDINKGTGKPTGYEMKIVKHHLINHVNLNFRYTAFNFYSDALKIVKKLSREDRIPLLVGGTGLYIKTLVGGIFSGPGADEKIRYELEILSTGDIYEKLKNLDPAVSEILSPNDRPRIIRALEVILGTGKSIIEHKRFNTHSYPGRVLRMYSDMPRDALYKRINERTDIFFRDGWIDEVKNLLKKFYNDKQAMDTLTHTIGYREIIEYIKNGGEKQVMIDEVKKQTRRFAKRQLTWFRNAVGSIPVDFNNLKKITKIINRFL